jgi:hypothetical protein
VDIYDQNIRPDGATFLKNEATRAPLVQTCLEKLISMRARLMDDYERLRALNEYLGGPVPEKCLENNTPPVTNAIDHLNNELANLSESIASLHRELSRIHELHGF